MSAAARLLALLLLLAAPAAPAWAQAGSVQVWSAKKGSSAAPGGITAEDVDANTRALHVSVVSFSATAPVNVSQFGGSAVVTGTGASGAGIPRVTLSNDSSLAANQSVNLAQIAGSTTPTGNGTAAGVLRVSVASDSTGTLAATQSGTWTVQPGNTANTTPWLVAPLPTTTGGLSISRTVAAASTNATNVKASAGQVYGLAITNEATALRWVHLYNTAGTPTCNSAIVASFGIPGNSTGAGNNVVIPVGAAFGTGIGFCITTTRDGTGSVTANDVTLNVLYR